MRQRHGDDMTRKRLPLVVKEKDEGYQIIPLSDDYGTCQKPSREIKFSGESLRNRFVGENKSEE